MGGADASQQESLRQYGMNLGTAFQLVDDLLDFTASDEVLGKPAGVDLLEGKLTLPLIYLLENEPEAAEVLEAVMLERSYERITRESLLEKVERAGALERARERASHYAAVALDALSNLPASNYCDALHSIPSYIIERDR